MGGNLEKKTYTYDEAVAETTKYFKGDKLAANAWVGKYALKDSGGNLYENSPDQMHKRLAKEFARIEAKYENPLSEDQIYKVIKDFKYIVPQGGPMTGIGNPYQITSVSNCFVIGEKADSYGGIMLMDQEQVQLMKRRGGVGHDLGHLRPKNAPVFNSAMNSTGIVPFMERYSNSTREVAQDGRRGALMLSIPIKHPDAESFIDAKMQKGKITGANVSVKIDDEFMKAFKENKPYIQQFPLDSENPTYRQEINPKDLWGKIIHNAWKSAEPGVLFWDTIENEAIPDGYASVGEERIKELNKKYNGNLEKISLEDRKVLENAKNLKSFKTVSTNPCGEIPLCPYDSCRLLAINLYSYVDNPFTEKAEFNFGKFKSHVRIAQRMMDDIVDIEGEKIDMILDKIEKDPEKEYIKYVEKNLWNKIKKKNDEGRRTGTGVTGEGDMLAALGLIYGTKQATEFSEEVHKTLAIEAYRSSVEMAEERGKFEIYDPEIEKDNPFINRIKDADPELYKRMEKSGRRNISLLTIAPTGTTSLMTQTTSGLEPVFLPVYERRKKVNPNDKGVRVDDIDDEGDAWQIFPVFHNKFEHWLNVKGYDVENVRRISDELYSTKDKIIKEKRKEELEEILKQSPYHKATSADVDWLEKVRMQGKIQKWVDHSISVTINLPENASEELIGELYMKAWEEGCKGVTVYREGSRKGVLSSGNEREIYRIPDGEINNPIKLPEIMPALRIIQNTPMGKMALFPVFDPSDQRVLETWGLVGNSGASEAATMEGMGRMGSLFLRSGGDLEKIIEQYEKIGSGEATIGREGTVQSLEMGFAKALIKYLVANNEIDPKTFFTGKVDLYKFSEEVADRVRKTGPNWKQYANGKENKKDEKKTKRDEPRKESEENEEPSLKGQKCPECGQMTLRFTEGCNKCSCGYSECGGG